MVQWKRRFEKCLRIIKSQVNSTNIILITIIWNITEQNRHLNLHNHCNTHWKICKFVAIVNQTFGLRLTFIIINEFHKLMFIPYLLAFNLLKTYHQNRISIFVNILFLCYHAAEMLLLVFLADSASSEVSKKISFSTIESTVKIKYDRIFYTDNELLGSLLPSKMRNTVLGHFH